MKKFLLLIFFNSLIFSQSLVQTIPLPRTSYYDQGYGLVHKSGRLWMSSGSSTTGNKGKLIAFDLNGAVTDSLQITYPSIRESQGLASDGTNFWYVERKVSRCDLYLVSPSGQVIDSIIPASPWYIGGSAWDGTGIWVSVYYPDAQAGVYKIDPATKQIVDTISVYGLQPQGVTIKGDTLFYVMDGFQGDAENIYAVNIPSEDTLFSFHVPELPGVRQNPRGLAWEGTNIWLMAEPIGASSGRVLFKYDLRGAGSPGISILTPNIDFLNVQVDSTKSADVFVKNYGTANLIIDSVSVSNSAFNFEISLPVTIKPDSTKSFQLKFKPSSNISYSDSVLFFHNDPNFVFSKVKMQGRGIYTLPYLIFSEPLLKYGPKRKNSTSYRSFSIFNEGSGKLRIDSLVVKDDKYYFVEGYGTFNIDSLSSKEMRLWFSPPVLGDYNDSLLIYSNASNGALIKLPLSGICAPYDSTLGSILWKGAVPENPSTAYNDLTARFMKNMEDINRDGVGDLLVATDNYFLLAYNGNSSNTSDILWAYNLYPNNTNTGTVTRLQAMQLISDLTGDGISDIVIGTGGGGESVIVINSVTGEKIWEFGDSVNYDQGDVNGLDVKRDWNGDGKPDILASASGNEYTGSGRFSVYLLNGMTGSVIWRIDHSAEKKLKDAVVSTDVGGAASSRVSGLLAGEVFGFNKLGQVLWTVPTAGYSPWGMVEIPDIGRGSSSDVIFGDFTGNLKAVGGDQGDIIWTASIGNAIVEDLILVPDMNKNGVPDVLVSALVPTLYLLEGANGNVIWTGSTSDNILGAGEVGDLNNDSIPELGMADLDNKVTILDGRNGAALFTYSFGTGANYPAECVWGIGDIDKSGTVDFAAGSRDGQVIAFSGGYKVIVGAGKDFTNGDMKFNLYQNYPNPFNPVTNIKYSLSKPARVSIKIYDALGNRCAVLVDEEKEAGLHNFIFNPANYSLSSGVYFYRLEAAGYSSVRKMMLMK